MKEGFYSKKSVLGVPNALILLMVIFFFVPFGGRGARMALQRTENNVKDWLPDNFRETEELAWFAERFVSEQFVVATWQGCRDEDQRLKLFVSKLRNEAAPGENVDRTTEEFRASQTGEELALFVLPPDSNNWGGEDERWLVDEAGDHYYIKPSGKLYRWKGNSNIVGAITRAFSRATGSFRLEGQFIAAFGDSGTDDAPNRFWADPRLLAAPLFKTVETGPETVAQLAGPGGSLHVPTEPTAGARVAIARLTGTLFGPAVPSGFQWTHEELSELLSEQKLAELPEGWQETWNLVVQQTVDESYDGDREAFVNADPVSQASAWYTFFDVMGVSEPPRQTCVVLTLTEPARRNLGRVIGRGIFGQQKGRLYELAEECGIAAPPKPTTAPPPFSWLAAKAPVVEPVMRIGGPPVDNVAIDEEGTITLVRLIGYSVVLGLGLSLVLLRSFRLMFMVFFVGGVSALASLGMVWWSDASVDAILLSMPSLVYVLGIAGAVHIVNYYRDAVAEKGAKGAPERAIEHAMLPCTLAAITTAIGLMSLSTSNILPIRKFGIFSAMGVMATLVLLYVYLPSALTIFPPSAKSIKDSFNSSTGRILRFWEAVGAFILRRHWWVNAVCLSAFIGLGYGLTKTETSVQLLKMFDSQSQIIQDYGWLEEHFGRLVPMELVVRFPDSLQRIPEVDQDFSDVDAKNVRWQLNLLERAEAVARVQKVLQNQFGYEGTDVVGRGMSATTFLRNLPDPAKGFAPERTAYVRLLQDSRDELLATDYLAVEDADGAEGTELWRISLRLGALNNVDYGKFVSSLRRVVEPVVASYRCRREVIQRLVGTDGERITGKTILVLGCKQPEHGIEELKSLQDDEDLSEAEMQKLIFASTLKSTLINDVVKTTLWDDPTDGPADGPTRDDQWWINVLEKRKVDCIVLAASDPSYNIELLKKQVPVVVDAESMLASIDTNAVDNHTPISKPVELSTYEGDMDVVYTGVVPVVYKAQSTLLVSLVESVFWAFVLIAFVMTCLLSPARSFLSAFTPGNLLQAIASGAVSMVPNVFPVVVIFGIMGHLGFEVDIGSMMTASVAMGVAVDDTIHFLTWFRNGLRRGLDRRDALFVAYKHVAPAMTQTTIIGGLGLSVFALSTFTPTQRFGTLMLVLLCAALVGDLIFLPAILASPIGRVFSVRPSKKKPDRTDAGLVTESYAGEGDSAEAGSEASDDQAAIEASEYRLAPIEPPGASVRRPQMLRGDKGHVRRR